MRDLARNLSYKKIPAHRSAIAINAGFLICILLLYSLKCASYKLDAIGLGIIAYKTIPLFQTALPLSLYIKIALLVPQQKWHSANPSHWLS